MKNTISTLRSFYQSISARFPIVGFAGVGVVSTAVDFAIFHLLQSAGLGATIAQVFSFMVGLSIGYMLNSILVFNTSQSSRGYTKYLIVSAVGLALRTGIIYTLHEGVFHTSANVAFFTGVVVVFVWNFTMSKLWAFK